MLRWAAFVSRYVAASLLLGIYAGPAKPIFGQQVISVQAATIDTLQGQVFLDDEQIRLGMSAQIQLKNGQHLRTESGRVGILLAPYMFLWLDGNSHLQINNNALTDTRLTLIKGSALIEIIEDSKKNRIEIEISGNCVHLDKEGVYRLDLGPNRVTVHSGEAIVTRGTRKALVKGGKRIDLQDKLDVRKLDKEKTPDPFHYWAGQRSFELFMKNETLRFAVGRSGKQKNWQYVGFGWLLHRGFNLRIPSAQYQQMILNKDARKSREEERLRRALPNIPGATGF